MDQRVVILGAGFGGVFVAKALSRHMTGIDIEIIDQNNYFVFQPLLPEVAGGTIHPGDAVIPLRLMLRGVKIRVARVLGIDFRKRLIEVVQGCHNEIAYVPYDHLVIGLGQVTDLDRYPGLADHSFTMKTVADGFSLRSQVIDCLEQADTTADPDFKRRLLTFVIIGGGLSGVETLGEVEHLISRILRYYPSLDRRDIRLVLAEYQKGILPEVAPPLAAYASDLLQDRGIEILTGVGVKSASIEAVELADGRTIGAATIVSTIGNAPSPLLRSLPLPKEKGRILTDSFLRVPGYDGLWAVGDAAAIPLAAPSSGLAPPTAQAATQEAERLARNILAAIAGSDLQPFHFEYRGQLASLGGHRAVADLFGHHVAGFSAWVLWRWIYLAMLPTRTTRFRVAVDWMLDSLLPRNIVESAQHHRRALIRQRFRKGDVVFRRNEAMGPFYMVMSGTFRRTDGNMDTLVRTGGHFGEGILQGERLRRSTVVTEEDGECLVMEPEDLEQLAAVISGLAPYLTGPNYPAERRGASPGARNAG